jgi:hypothetical protein
MPLPNRNIPQGTINGVHNALEYAVACLKCFERDDMALEALRDAGFDDTAREQLKNALAQIRPYYLDEDSVSQHYEGGICPDCKTPIPSHAHEGEACENCGHVFYPETPDDDISSAADLTAEAHAPESNSGVVFKVDGQEVRVGNDVKAEASLPDGSTLIVTLTHEGIIMDFWTEGANEPDATSSIMYDEQATEMTG